MTGNVDWYWAWLVVSDLFIESWAAADKAAVEKTANDKTAATKAPAKKAAASKAVGKVVKVAATKKETAAVEVLKSLPPKRAKAVKAPADAVPVKKVLKRVKKDEAE